MNQLIKMNNVYISVVVLLWTGSSRRQANPTGFRSAISQFGRTAERWAKDRIEKLNQQSTK
jgi:hypothetical protein